MTTPTTFQAVDFDGKKALERLIQPSEYGSLLQAAASLTLFSHPQTVADTEGMNLFPMIRGTPRGTKQTLNDGHTVMLDDNQTPTQVFVWANCLWNPIVHDAQFNHLVPASKDARLYTSLTNICVTPAFLSRVMDSKTCREVQLVLRYHACRLYGKCGLDTQIAEPPIYRDLNWAPPLPYTPNVEKRFRDKMKSRPKLRATRAAREIGWYFSKYQPDATV